MIFQVVCSELAAKLMGARSEAEDFMAKFAQHQSCASGHSIIVHSPEGGWWFCPIQPGAYRN